MTTEPQWMISLAPSAPEKGRLTVESADVTVGLYTEEMSKAANKLSDWLGLDYVAEMTNDDLNVLTSSLAVLKTTVSTNDMLWKAIPDTSAIPEAEALVAKFTTAQALAEEQRRNTLSLIDGLGIDRTQTLRHSIVTATTMNDRYGIAINEISEIVRILTEPMGIDDPTLEDVAFVSGVLPSLKTVDADLLAVATPTSDEMLAARDARDTMVRLSDEMNAEFKFEPILYGADALGGVRRAFATKKAPDFISAARNLGAVVSGPEQAQKAASLMKEYLAADELLSGVAMILSHSRAAPSTSIRRIKDSLAERMKLVQSLNRRRSVLAFNENNLSQQLTRLGENQIDKELFDTAASMNSDTRKLVEDNINAVGGNAKARHLLNHLSLINNGLDEWATLSRNALDRSSVDDMTHEELDSYLKKHPVLVSNSVIEYSISTSDEAREIERHLNWLREAAMLPLSDEKLTAYLARHGRDEL